MKPREDFSLIKVILWDIDGTLLNFKMSERYAIDYCFNKFHMGTCTDEMLQRYSVINRGYWERLETGELTREQVMLGRFHEFFESEGLPTDQVKVFNDEYQIRLGDKAFFCDHGDELVKQLKATVKQYAVTNGTTVAQERKLRFSGLDQLLDGVFAPDEVVIVGDSLTSDIRGGKNAGILTCWYNPDHLPNKIEVTPDCTIDNLQDILSYLDESR